MTARHRPFDHFRVTQVDLDGLERSNQGFTRPMLTGRPPAGDRRDKRCQRRAVFALQKWVEIVEKHDQQRHSRLAQILGQAIQKGEGWPIVRAFFPDEIGGTVESDAPREAAGRAGPARRDGGR